MNVLFLNAIKDATKVRDNFGLNMFEPANIYDICKETGVLVKIVNINMEGIYVKESNHKKPTILLSNERPIPRRVFTCAHEYGHYYYGHGSKIDMQNNTNKYTKEQNQEELLVDTFASFLLMPISGVKSQFAKRILNPNNGSPTDYFQISSYFGVGYNTLVYHCKANKLIGFDKMQKLLKYSPAKIFKESFSSNIQNSHFKYIDDVSQPKVLDLEVGNYLILPFGSRTSKIFLKEVQKTKLGIIYEAIKQGVSEVISDNFINNISVRIERKNYTGLSNYRHLE